MMMYLYMFVAIQIMATLGAIAAYRTQDTRWPFIIGFNTMLPVTCIILYHADGVAWRHLMLLGFVGIYLARMNWVLLFWFANTGAAKLKGQMSRKELLGLPVIVANTFGWLYCLPFLWTATRTGGFDLFDGLALGSYIIGTVFHFGADYQKRRFKSNPANKGQLITSGFWGLSRHPNYFGDFLIYLGFALSSGAIWGLAAPIANVAQYWLDAIPKNERQAAQKYSERWINYAARVKCFIPFVL
ncbi:MAG: oxidoreductase [Rhodobacteraceae bacterium]|nr:MAG: oxidoreductase [Paracoccaceae bacterium]